MQLRLRFPLLLFMVVCLLLLGIHAFPTLEHRLRELLQDDSSTFSALHRESRRISQDEVKSDLTSTPTPCYLCPDGSPVGLPFKTPGFGIDGTCAQLDQSAQEKLTSGAPECAATRFFSGICGCPPVEDACRYCNGEETPDPDYILQSVAAINFPPISCRDFGLFSTQVTEESFECLAVNYFAYLCGCSDEFLVRKDYLLFTVLRTSAVMSILGSFFIVFDVCRNYYKSGIFSVYHELVLTMSSFDFLSSTAWVLGSLPIPAINEWGEPHPTDGAKGNNATCTAQGFLMQLGLTGTYHICLFRGML
jgi:hypothetical protein